MLIADISTTPRRRAPIPGGPTVATLTPASSSDQVAAVHVEIPAGGGMPEHDHGASEIILIPLSGSAEVRHDGQTRTLRAGIAAHIAAGERVSLANPGPGPASLMVVASRRNSPDASRSGPPPNRIRGRDAHPDLPRR